MLAAALTPPFAVISALLVVAGGAKLRSGERALGAAEAALGTVALVAPTAVAAALVALAYAAFAGHVLRLLVAGDDAPCGCLGASSRSASAAHLALDLGALAIAAAAVVEPPHGLGWLGSLSPAVAAVLVLGVAGATYAAYLMLAALPDAWRAYGTDARG